MAKSSMSSAPSNEPSPAPGRALRWRRKHRERLAAGGRWEAERLAKLARLRERGLHPYPARVARGHRCAEARAAFERHEATSADTPSEPPTVRVCGRIRRLNIKGRLSFLHIAD